MSDNAHGYYYASAVLVTFGLMVISLVVIRQSQQEEFGAGTAMML
jgi:hypothetical protein